MIIKHKRNQQLLEAISPHVVLKILHQQKNKEK